MSYTNEKDLIAIDGIDGTGKTTLCEYMEVCCGYKRFAFPSARPIGALIRSALMGSISISRASFLDLFIADGIDASDEIREVNKTHHVVIDRHPVVSSWVFQGPLHGTDVIERRYEEAFKQGLIRPSKTFILDLDEEESDARMAKRVKYRDVVFEEASRKELRRRRTAYRQYAGRAGMLILDAATPVDQICKIILDAIRLNPRSDHDPEF